MDIEEMLVVGLITPIYPLIFYIIHRLGQLEGAHHIYGDDL